MGRGHGPALSEDILRPLCQHAAFPSNEGVKAGQDRSGGDTAGIPATTAIIGGRESGNHGPRNGRTCGVNNGTRTRPTTETRGRTSYLVANCPRRRRTNTAKGTIRSKASPRM